MVLFPRMNSRAFTVARSFLLLLGLCGEFAFAVEPGMVFIPGGDFSRGRTYDWPDTRLVWYPNPLKDDLPVRKIYVDPFYMDEAEVTNERYAEFVKATRHRMPYHWRGGKFPEGTAKRPVVNVDWDDATAFCAWDAKRLPTEAEWERSCRGIAEGKMYPWGDTNPNAKQAVFGLDTGAADVCSKEKSYFGLCDIVGNVWEWTSDWYDRRYYEVAPDRNPPGPDKGVYRVVRGGSWFDTPQQLFMTCSYRSWTRQPERSPTIGFRCVKGISGTTRKTRSALR